jgi:oligogalacturonide lyase
MATRRSFLSLVSSPFILKAAGKGTVLDANLTRYNDLATDLTVTRLTDPRVSSILPRGLISARGFLLYASDASSRWEVYRMELKSGESRQLTSADALVPESLTMLSSDAGFSYYDGSRFTVAPISGTVRAQQIAYVEQLDSFYRLRLRNAASVDITLAEAKEELREPLLRPKRASVLYRRGGSLYLANFDGKQNYRLRTPEGTIAQAHWSPDGRSVFYLHLPGPGRLNAIREFVPDTNEDRLIAETTQFVSFAPNRDASVFVGAGGSPASPYVFLLARAVKRELTLCEHRASDPRIVVPVFSPNSQQVYFTSDLHGKPAIYRMDVQRLVSETKEPGDRRTKQ